MKNNRYIVIVGCGRLGSHLANRLSREGHSVVVIDRYEATFGNLSPDFSGFRVRHKSMWVPNSKVVTHLLSPKLRLRLD